MTDFTIYPAIDIREGRVVRLHKGDYDKETRYPSEPLGVARGYAEGGARWLHLVDLDAARAGGYTLTPLLREIVAETSLQVQTGGGVRGKEDVAALLDAGASRVVVGSLAVREPETVAAWIEEFGSDRITVALDTRTGEDGSWVLPTSGWTSDTETDLAALLSHYARSGLAHALCTDIGRDGTMSGPNLNLYTFLTRAVPDVAVQASGGTRHAADVRGVRKIGCAGVILGKALLEGRLTIDEAIAEERE
ncbi:1-(5-phosphoribosyl)-5-[(5-phosphoribosylamino)methylideneamino]imidazole-4-carboxamide isomerase [Ornithinimicrobium sp. F0845]|uniref:1-(5-phosphoribosyl)-5-[(5- phosphoribosylamino)methylideneamino]imidazole-4- carboxamide isomerase n=1 Tax=Ornithinimicrobium sp. F0845 TaxID=2926412 RepID=UPI001FF5ABB7|nr:1-(5-phosphoribosyl)-5-[(5-phosphoribosylamino)methylideneamino]imidazole-4-carboxamide isomerase [Ornithinimicrobium sp. F0845]MCK0111958.1 1-(5-phosphoribosyl)-5-[(5-phosphoribosylamino)methylideneamino]imidazole-4-carboxamide isomerase [Ornithinimicrobium sp. F0845]